ncbi:MAG: 30S ribosomal protein S9 [candidate division WOR-3 bacterium]|nr:30S ribosomal protein S9 [candidate division WOR-3 bacterium]MCX7836604.1 30S ribosomal protein S9 [candidate division WOR-3 bacterium]MDW8113348.1 30S ribosomal protein S9 [candidate division WOR-3 bacterium]
MSQFYFASGSRKEGVAKVWLYPKRDNENWKFIVNNQPIEKYFGRFDLVLLAQQPLKVTNLLGHFDVKCEVKGGGKSGQAGAISLGIARALVSYQPELRKILSEAGLLKRDPREKERCKYGLAKRRKSFQWTKR